MQRIIQLWLGALILLSFVGAAMSQTSYSDRKGESLVPYNTLKSGVESAPDLLSDFKKECKRLTQLMDRVKRLEADNLWGHSMRRSIKDLEASFQRLVQLRAELAIALLNSYNASNSKDVAAKFGWTESQIKEIDSFKETAFKIFRKMSEVKIPIDEEVIMLLDRVDQSMQSRLVYYTSRLVFYKVVWKQKLPFRGV